MLNVYGPTECCDVTTVHPVTDPSRYPDNYLTIPIGRPLENTYVYLLDKDGEVANEGEMFIGGLGVGKGYINNHHLTQNHFIENPFRKGEKMYRTGDVAKRLIDGSLLFLGRMDNQVKINGHRIEPKEIEHLLNSHDQIQQVIVIEVDGEGSGKKLCAFYAAQDEIPVEELRYFLSVQLPHYMIPSYFVRLKRFPVNSNGKVDRKTLAEYRFMGINS
ncbi:Tyrocidine synthase 1 [compost metagenome]